MEHLETRRLEIQRLKDRLSAIYCEPRPQVGQKGYLQALRLRDKRIKAEIAETDYRLRHSGGVL